LLFCVQVVAQNGRPIVINYSPRDYSGEDQIWTLVQDHSGLLYFGGYNGVYVYDGEKWEFVGESNRFSTVLSLDIDEHGTVFVGYVDGFGYLKPNEHGKQEIISLSEELDSSQTVTDVWTMACVGETAYFCSDKAVFRYHPDSMPSVKNIFSTFNPYLLYKVENNVFVSDGNGNFNRIMGDSVRKIDGNVRFFPMVYATFCQRYLFNRFLS
jgi:ligand-binding sensor domain-containing protein